MIGEYFTNIFTIYEPYILLLVVLGILSIFLTPLTGVLAKFLDAIDHPPQKRDPTDSTKFRRVHTKSMPTLGGLAMYITMMIGIAWLVVAGRVDFSLEILAIVCASTVIAIAGYVDSTRDLRATTQLFSHVLAGAIVALGGIKIGGINIGDFSLDFTVVSFEIATNLGSITIAPLADLVTIFWVVMLINAINWVSGIDGLAATISQFAGWTLLFLAIKFDVVLGAYLAVVFVGSGLGPLLFNLPPAKTYNGTIGDQLQGLILAILAIVTGAKFSAGLIILIIPLLDMLWVLFGRYLTHQHKLKNPLEILNISDKTHLHHRLLKLGFSKTQVLILESTIFLLFCIGAYYVAGFRQEILMVMVAVFIGLVVFSLIAIWKSIRASRPDPEPIPENKQEESIVTEERESPEEKYAY